MNVSDSETSSVCDDDVGLISDTSGYDAEVNSSTTSSDGDDGLDDGSPGSSHGDTLEYELVSQHRTLGAALVALHSIESSDYTFLYNTGARKRTVRVYECISHQSCPMRVRVVANGHKFRLERSCSHGHGTVLTTRKCGGADPLDFLGIPTRTHCAQTPTNGGGTPTTL
ncbi:hypothetical protein PF008_g25696 [Phytophthora fragariae]|uniref:Uncharacterized protein n=1 Tax=Phytophthora fragariae TaxID=53985 RepID=A0A6G0QJZ3_9STRA|nr:hypothetical protein PF008_g25696 [Phytophthora fragariae]